MSLVQYVGFALAMFGMVFLLSAYLSWFPEVRDENARVALRFLVGSLVLLLIPEVLGGGW